MSNGEQFFKANKGTRGSAFAVPSPIPMDDAQAGYGSTPFGNDKNVTTHLQPPAPEGATLPGETPDPRC